MIPAAFDYVRPNTLDEALAALGSNPEAKVIAGGQSLLPLMKLRVARVGMLVDIGRIGELKGVRALDDGRLAVGAMTTYTELLDSPARHYGLIRDAVPTVGDVQVRNRGTIGGSIAHADPAGDLPACLLALDAEVILRSPSGERSVSAERLFTGAFETSLAPDEVITEIRLPGPRDDAGSAYCSLEQAASGYALVGVAAVVVRGDNGSPSAPIVFARIGITGVSDVAYRATEVEAALAGSDGSPGSIQAAAAHATDGRRINADIHADAEYRAAMAVVYTRRAIERALARLTDQ